MTGTKVFRGGAMPDFLREGADRFVSLRGEGRKVTARAVAPLPDTETVPVTEIGRRFAHVGKGVYEERRTGKVWIRDGEVLRREATDRDRVVAEYLAELEAAEGRRQAAKPEYQPKTGRPCSCRPGQQRDNCPTCEGTGQTIDFAAIRARPLAKSRVRLHELGEPRDEHDAEDIQDRNPMRGPQGQVGGEY